MAHAIFRSGVLGAGGNPKLFTAASKVRALSHTSVAPTLCLFVDNCVLMLMLMLMLVLMLMPMLVLVLMGRTQMVKMIVDN